MPTCSKPYNSITDSFPVQNYQYIIFFALCFNYSFDLTNSKQKGTEK